MFFGILGILVLLIIIIVIGSLPAYFFFRHQQRSNHAVIMQMEFQALLQKGQIDTEVYQKLISLYPLPEKRSPVTLLQIVYIIGSILIGIGAILFIASNWQQMADWFKLALAVVLSFVSLFLGDYFRQKKSRKLPVLGESLILLGALLWGVVIIFLFQHYQWSVTYNWLLVGIWIVSLLPILLWMKSEPVFYLVMVLTFIFGIFCRDLVGQHFWIYLVLSGALFFLAKQNRVKEGIIAGTQFIFGFTCLEHVTEAITFWLFASLFHQLLCLLRKRNEDLVYATVPLILAGFFTMLYFLNPVVNYNAENNWTWLQTVSSILALLMSSYLIYIHQSVAGLILWLTSGYLFLWGVFQSRIFPYEHYQYSRITDSFEATLGYIAGIILLVMAFAVIFQKRSRLYSAWLPMTQLFLWIPLFLLSTKWHAENTGTQMEKMDWLIGLILIILPLLMMVAQYFIQKARMIKWSFLAFTWICVAASLASLIWWRDASIFVVNFALLFTIIQAFFWSYEEDQPALFYIGMVALIVFILLRYFDLFWSMMSRSAFFIIGGVLLVTIAVLLERQRYRLDKSEEKHENS